MSRNDFVQNLPLLNFSNLTCMNSVNFLFVDTVLLNFYPTDRISLYLMPSSFEIVHTPLFSYPLYLLTMERQINRNPNI